MVRLSTADTASPLKLDPHPPYSDHRRPRRRRCIDAWGGIRDRGDDLRARRGRACLIEYARIGFGQQPRIVFPPFSRNPIYLAFSALQVGIALCVGSLWLLITLVPALALMSLWVIPREERYLEARFSSEYLSYKSSVRRWL